MIRLNLTLLLLLSLTTGKAQHTVFTDLTQKLDAHTEHDTIRVNLLNELGYQYHKNQPAQTLRLSKEALSIALALNYKKGTAEAYKNIGNYYLTQSNHGACLEAALQGLRIFESLEDKKGIAQSYLLLGTLYLRLKELEKSRSFYDQALAISTAENLRTEMGRAYLGIGMTQAQKRDVTVLKYYHQAFEYLKNDERPASFLPEIFYNMASAYFSILDKKDSSEYCYTQSLTLGRKFHSRAMESASLAGLGKIYAALGQYDKAEKFITDALVQVKQYGNKNSLLVTYFYAIELYTDLGKKDEAHAFMVKYAATKDSLYSTEKSRQITEIQTLYETEKKEREIQVLEQEKKIQAIWQQIFISGLITMIVISIAIFFLQRSRTRKARELLEVQQALNDKLQEVDKLKSRFFATISHEFRTPLTLILGPLEEKLSHPELSSADQSIFLTMQRNARRLLHLINQILDLSKLENGKMELKLQQGNLAETINFITSSFDSLATLKNISYIKNISINYNDAHADHDKLEKIIFNLLSNAFKFTPSDGTVNISVVTALAPKPTLTIQVEDTGIGIAESDQQNLFKPFYQIDNSDTKDVEGSGLGLSLVKELVKLHGGTITVASEPGKGATFNVVLPISKDQFNMFRLSTEPIKISGRYNNMPMPSAPAEILDETPQHQNNPTVLIVEDNQDVRHYIKRTLQDIYTVIEATDGEAGQEQALQHLPDLIIMDVMMPRLDGTTLSQRLKNDERTSHIPIIMLTAKAGHESRLEGLKTGADDYLIKPFNTEELLTRISNLILIRKKLIAKYKKKLSIDPAEIEVSSVDHRFLQKVAAVIESFMSEPDFGVEKLAEEIGMSRATLHRKLKALIGSSAGDFIRDQRLKRAAQLLMQNVDNVAQIGHAVGFDDQSYFAKCFKKQFGVSPSEYRNSNAG